MGLLLRTSAAVALFASPALAADGEKKGGMPHPTSQLMFNIMAPRTNINFLQRIEQMGGVEQYVRAKYKAAGLAQDTATMAEEVAKWNQRLKGNTSSMEFNIKDMRAAIVHTNRVTKKTLQWVRKGRAAAPTQEDLGGSVTAAARGVLSGAGFPVEDDLILRRVTGADGRRQA